MTSVRVLTSSIAIGLAMLCGASVANAQLVGASPQALAFVYQIGGPNPAAQSIFLSSDVPTQFSVTLSGAPWLSVAPISGLTPSTLVATVTAPQGATPGTLSGSIIIGPAASTDALKTVVSVTLQVLAPPQGNLIVSPNNLTFDYQAGGPLPASFTVSINSSGGPASFSLATSTSWLFVSASSSVTPAYAQVSVNPTSAMGPGVYTGTVNVNPTYAGGVAVQIFVTLRIAGWGSLTASPSFLSFTYQGGGPFPPAQILTVVNSSGGSVPYSVACSSQGGWLSCSPLNASTPSSIVVSCNPGAFAPGTYSGTISINPGTTGVTATQVPVTLTVYSYSQLVVDPTALLFDYQTGGPTPPTQYVSVKSTSSPVTYTVSVQGPVFVTVSGASGTTPNGFGVSATPTPSTPPGTYTANITISPNNGGGAAVSIPVTVHVGAPNYLTLGRSSVSFDYTAGGINPPPVLVPVTSSSGSLHFSAFAATSGFGPWLSVVQSSQYTPADITIGVSPHDLAPGTYSGTVVVSADGASNGDQSIAVTLTVTNTVSFAATPFGRSSPTR